MFPFTKYSPRSDKKAYSRMVNSRSCKVLSKKKRLFKKWKKTHLEKYERKYITYRNTLKATLKKTERYYYSQKFQVNANNLKKTWKIIGKIIN